MTAGSLDTSSQEAKDWLFIGTATSLTAYEVDSNRDAFHVEVPSPFYHSAQDTTACSYSPNPGPQAPDGANAITLGQFDASSEAVVIIGGSCSIYGYNHAGDDTYWTVRLALLAW